ncbi:hypothetical protein [Actinomadura sp. HBU206391]|uniref:divisome protein SepX/GlpR n=1 Tax=Actinomadura sp. HBU206391 TaxID=2731692 RepID=UPI00164F9F3D|nr:hypothetical protein [Actinomadura sp. HBU206391]MBC6460595.1 hypothetical protein [Actinomadura sp. HBU206391]
MSSTLLYLAIVAVWAVVLVPMYLRRDSDNAGISRLLHRRSGMAEPGTGDTLTETVTRTMTETTVGDRADSSMAYEPAGHGDPPPALEEIFEEDLDVPARRGVSRATVIARRRRRTFLLTVANLSAIGVVASGLAPWWVALPPVGLLVFHLALLRVAVGMDAVRHERLMRARAEARAEARVAEQARRAEEAVKAQIIDLAERARARDVFDQHAKREGDEDDVARAVGD